MTPDREEWGIGSDKYGRNVRLIRTRSGDWSIVRDPANQRDDGCNRLDDLSDAMMISIFDIVADRRR